MYGGPRERWTEPQDILPYYLNHENVVELVQPYHNAGMIAQQYEMPFMMFETNTASCGGFPGISNSYVAAIWGLDYGLQMAYSNFTHAMLHIGGQNVFYNVSSFPSSLHLLLDAHVDWIWDSRSQHHLPRWRRSTSGRLDRSFTVL